MIHEIIDGKTRISLETGTKLNLGNVEITIDESGYFLLDGELSYEAVVETVAAAGQAGANPGMLEREDGDEIIRYNGFGQEIGREAKPAPKAKGKAKK